MKHEILSRISENSVVQQILNNTNRVGNLFDMEEALCLASAFEIDHKTRIIVKRNRYQAQQLYQRLAGLVDDVLLFVMEESLRVQSLAYSPEDKNEFIYSLTQLVKDEKPRLIICNLASFIRYLPDKELFKEYCLHLEVDDEFGMEKLRKQLNRMGYSRINYVDRPGTFASRGGIVDIYSLEYEHPVRIEFFDTEIESIRFFDETTQRTIKTIDSIDIAPVTDLLFTDAQIEKIKEEVSKSLEKEVSKLREEEAELLTDYVEADLRALDNYDGQPHLYSYFSYCKGESIVDYVDGIVIFSPIEEIERQYKKITEENISFIQEKVQDHMALPRYIIYNDLNVMKKKTKCINFHQFLDMEHPVMSDIYPLEKARLPLLNQLEAMSGEKIYLALHSEQKKKVNEVLSYRNLPDFTYIDADFYEGFVYKDIAVYTDKELFTKAVESVRYHKQFKDAQIIENVMELEKNDYIVHVKYGIGQYLGIVTRNNNGKMMDYLHVAYSGNDSVFIPLSQFQRIRKYISKEGAGVKLSKIGTNAWQKTKEKVSQKVEEIAERLIDLYAVRNEDIGFAFPEDDALQIEFDEACEFEPTPDQIKATREIKDEMEKPKPMDHLLCGDVGFGKTEVAMRCAFKALSAGKQVAFLCPTTILSMQHYKTVSDRFEYTGANVELVNRFVPDKKIKEIKKRLEEGKIDIIIGTHKLLNKTFKYKDLGFLIIDEEHRFGVEHKERIKELSNKIDVLSLSATPIPRTLQMSLIGIRTISQLNTPPAQRHPIQTYVMERRGNIINDVIERELGRNGQVFYLYNKIANIYSIASKLAKDFPNASVAVAHGRMSKEEVEDTMLAFAEGKYQILVCTTIIEIGLDIANANTMIIEDADHFGLSQLYQIRGRVGRRNRIGYCYLMIEPNKELTEAAEKRLKSIKEFTQLGSGYKIAMRDLTIRGAGDLLGPQQSGFIDQVGLDMYLDLLSGAIARKKGEAVPEKKEEKKAAVSMSGYIPAKFTDNDGDKLALYQEIKSLNSEEDITKYKNRVEDLFGRIPLPIQQLFNQRKVDIFANKEEVYDIHETMNQIIIEMSPAFSQSCNGEKLFNEITKISRMILLKLNKGKITITIPKQNKKYEDLLVKVVDVLQEKFL